MDVRERETLPCTMTQLHYLPGTMMPSTASGLLSKYGRQKFHSAVICMSVTLVHVVILMTLVYHLLLACALYKTLEKSKGTLQICSFDH